MFQTHSHTQCLRPMEMAKPSPYRPGEAEWRSSPLVRALISAVWTTKINNPSFFLLGLLPYKNQRPPLVLYKINARRSLVVVGLVLLIQGRDAQQISVFLLMRLLFLHSWLPSPGRRHGELLCNRCHPLPTHSLRASSAPAC